MRYDTVNEKSTSIVTLSFADEAGNAVTPTSGTYRIDDVASGTQIKGDTAFTPVSSTHEITISDSENAILDSDNARELRCVTVSVTYGVGKKCTAEYRYYVVNLMKIS